VLLLCLAALVSLGIRRAFVEPARAGGEPAPQPRDRAAAERPVILLTGFEPFGEKRPPNSSWEGIRQLDGQEWKGYRLVCKQMKVVWGAPLEQLQGWVAEYRPVAVLSFGMGMGGSFALESRGNNERAPIRDNLGRRPPRPNVVEDGPGQLPASIDAERFARVLSAKGYPVRVSTDAGRYLCDETLYTLEYLKGGKKIDGAVLFCHVPPLDSHLRNKPVTADYVEQFVKDVLETWRLLYARTKDPREQEVKEMIARYFRTWSEQDIDGYNDCFLPDACVQFIETPGGRLSTTPRLQFIRSQKEYHERSPDKSVEVPETIDVRFEERLARVVVFWKLTAGPRTEYGYDHFTLMKHNGSWRIVNLVFYTTPR
jgi:pyrrolidone-carboxylate peptidase